MNSTTNLQFGHVLPQVRLNTARRGEYSRSVKDTVTIEGQAGES